MANRPWQSPLLRNTNSTAHGSFNNIYFNYSTPWKRSASVKWCDVIKRLPCNILLTLFIYHCHKICFVFTSEFIFLLIYRVVDITRSGACNESQVQNMFACLFISVYAFPLYVYKFRKKMAERQAETRKDR